MSERLTDRLGSGLTLKESKRFLLIINVKRQFNSGIPDVDN